ncbi:hypothetical protein ABW21_db0203865 [Orbilia brochopaga]|nr:hypothetical protein ABW21_db0203865 [Drechslerella brochopaga]
MYHGDDAIDVLGEDFYGTQGGRGYRFDFNKMPDVTGQELNLMMALYDIEPVRLITTMLASYPIELGNPEIASISFVLYHQKPFSATVIVGLQRPDSGHRNNALGKGDIVSDSVGIEKTFRVSPILSRHPFFPYLEDSKYVPMHLENSQSYALIALEDKHQYPDILNIEGLSFNFHVSVLEKHMVVEMSQFSTEFLAENESLLDSFSKRLADMMIYTWKMRAGQSAIRHIMFPNVSHQAKALIFVTEYIGKAVPPNIVSHFREENPTKFDNLEHTFTTTTREGMALESLLAYGASLPGRPYIDAFEFGWAGQNMHDDAGWTPTKPVNPFILVHLGVTPYIEDQVSQVEAASSGDQQMAVANNYDNALIAAGSHNPQSQWEDFIDDLVFQGCRQTAEAEALYPTV